MHHCLSVHDWIKAWGHPEKEDHRLATCSRCTPYRHDLAEWHAAVQKCPECRAVLEAVPFVADEVVNCTRCMDSFAKLHEILDELEHYDPAVASEAWTAEELFGKLVRLAVTDQVVRVTGDARHWQWGLTQRFLHDSRRHWCTDPELANHRAAVAVTLAGLLDSTTYHPEWVADLRAKAHAYLANTHRILAEFPSAEREFLAAENHLRRGVGSGRCQAEVFSLKASLLVDQGRYVEAGALLDVVEGYYRRAGEGRALARALLQRAMVAAGEEDFEGAAEECGKAAASLEPERDARLATLARQNAVHYLVQAGDVERARELFDVLPPSEGRSMALRRKWVEGDLLRAEGRYRQALDAYQEARRGYGADGRHYYMALIALEEALIAFDLGDATEVGTMAEEASILLVKAAAKHQALAVIRVLLSAIERGTVDRATLVTAARRVAALKPS